MSPRPPARVRAPKTINSTRWLELRRAQTTQRVIRRERLMGWLMRRPARCQSGLEKSLEWSALSLSVLIGIANPTNGVAITQTLRSLVLGVRIFPSGCWRDGGGESTIPSPRHIRQCRRRWVITKGQIKQIPIHHPSSRETPFNSFQESLR